MPVGHVWIWCVAFTLIFVVWNIALERMQNKVAQDVNQHNVTAADYSVMLTGISSRQCTPERLIAFASHYGQVFAGFHLVAVGPVLTVCNEVRLCSWL